MKDIYCKWIVRELTLLRFHTSHSSSFCHLLLNIFFINFFFASSFSQFLTYWFLFFFFYILSNLVPLLVITFLGFQVGVAWCSKEKKIHEFTITEPTQTGSNIWWLTSRSITSASESMALVDFGRSDTDSNARGFNSLCLNVWCWITEAKIQRAALPVSGAKMPASYSHPPTWPWPPLSTKMSWEYHKTLLWLKSTTDHHDSPADRQKNPGPAMFKCKITDRDDFLFCRWIL